VAGASGAAANGGADSDLERVPVGRTRQLADRSPSTARTRPVDLDGAAFAILEKLNRGVLVLDATGTVLFMNGAAEVMFARNSGLLLRGRCLRFEASTANAALEHFLERGCSTPDCASLVLRVDGTRLKRPYRVLVSPLEPVAPSDGRAVCYSVFVYEPNGGQRPLPVPLLRMLYGLTVAEARLSNGLFAGLTLADAAKAQGTTVNTAKFTLKSIFAKCAVSSQAELLLLLSLGPRTL
jgi:DNA-binding CsgD family transcriptional regulator